jgi:RNA polymerase sigma factor (sigma-70 family)
LTEQIEISKLIDHLFRHESGKLVSVLTRIFGTQNLDLAEDVVQDSLIEAMGQWQYKGVPENPSAWLFRVAKNKALNILNREKYKREYSSDIAHYLQSEWTVEPALNHLFSEREIQDDQLRMIFTCCHPSISPDSQIALALKTLCGFSIPEIAKAFLTTEENINKRLVRARQNIRDANISFDIPMGNELEKRLQTVLETIYLLFNEGYSASNGNDIIRYELCEEAIRLTHIITDDKSFQQKGNVFALLALMYLNASRFKARQDTNGNLLTMQQQDYSLWDNKMIGNGLHYLELSTMQNDISVYHILATISAQYCIAKSYDLTNWKTILSLYNHLIEFENSPVVLLNRAVVISKVNGAKKAIAEMEKIKNTGAIKSYYLFYSTQAEFQIELKQYAKAISSLKTAITLAPLQAERALLAKRLQFCESQRS